MPDREPNREPKIKLTRRQFLTGAGLTAAAAVLAGCDPTNFPPTEIWPTQTKKLPTGTPRPTGIPKDTPTPKHPETPTPNEVALGSAEINPKLLEDGFGHIGGGEVVLPPSGADSAIGGGAEQQTVDQLVVRTNKNWDLYINSFKFEDLGSISQDGNLKRLMTAISAGSGFDRTTYNLAVRFLALKDAEGTPLRLLPFQIFKVGTGSGVEEIVGWPQGNAIRDGTNITIVGQYVDEKGKDQYVLSYTEYFKRSEDDRSDVPNVPRYNWLIAEREQFEHLVGEANKDLPEGVSGLTLAGKEVSFTDGKKNYSWKINTISPEIVKAVKDSAEFMRVDMIGDDFAEKPVVPFPVGFDLPKEYETSYDKGTGVVSVYFKENGVLSEKPKLTASYNAESKAWEWAKTEAEKPAWLPEVSNTVAKFNADKNIWEYYSTDSSEAGKYVVSVKENNGSYEFNNFAEELVPGLHPELFVKATWEEMAQRMQETGAVKSLFTKIENVSKFEIVRFNDNSTLLVFYLKNFPTEVYYPYLKESQVSPSNPRILVYFFDINPDINKPIALIAYSNKPYPDSTRLIEDDENFVGQTGIIANFGQLILRVKSGIIALGGRDSYDNNYNSMLLDSFVRDEQGRLMHH